MRGGMLSSEWRERLPPICPVCGYNLTGYTSTRCPECGQQFILTELRQNAKDAWYAMQQAEDMNMILGVGVYTGVAGVVLVLGLWLLGWTSLSALAGLFLGFATMSAGAQVARAKRIPEWAREYVTIQPDYIKAVVVTLFGVAIMAAAFFLP